MNDRVFRAAWVIAFFVIAFAIFWFSRRVLLLLFSGLLIALILTSLINLIRRFRPVGQRTGLALVLLFMAALITGTGFLTAPQISQQFSELADRIPKLLRQTSQKIQDSPVFQKIENALPDASQMVPSGGLSRVTSFFSSTFDALSSLIFVAFTALFLAVNPGLYRRILIKLIPPRHRQQAGDTTARVICTLKFWLLGQLISMLAVGILVGIGMAIAGLPLALALGILAGLLEFIPIIGPILAAIPALLLAASQGGRMLLIVLGIFMVIQFLEGNVIVPLAQRKAVDLPPIITFVALLLMGGAFGLLGLFVAAPLAAALLILLEDLYLKRYLGTNDKLLD